MFAPAYERRFWSGDERKVELVLHPLFKKFMDEGKSVEHFVGSRDLSVRDHLEVQKLIQKHVDNAVSKTINIPQDYPIEDMEALWLEYLPHLKGTTFYRENTRGYVREDGTLEEPPLKALSLEEAKSKYSVEAQVGKDDNDCPNGICSL
jgi:ribonucleoside-diphosphate reductase alpha chain